MSRHFSSIQEFSLCLKASVTVRVVDVEPTMQFFAKKNVKTGLMESVPYFKGILQDATSSIRCVWWSMPDQHVAFQGLIGKCVTASGVQITLSHVRYADLNRFSVSFDGVRLSEMKVIADVASIPTMMVTTGGHLPGGSGQHLQVQGNMLPGAGGGWEMYSSQSLSPSPLKRPSSTEQACCDRPDMPFCLRRPGVRHVPKCQLCGAALNDTLNPVCGMTGVLHLMPEAPGKPELARRLMELFGDTNKEEDSEKKKE